MRITLWSLLILILLGACSKQNPSAVKPDYVDGSAELDRGEACRQVDLTKDLLELKNSKNLFKCATWDKKFPKLYKALLKVDVQKWDYITAPLNEYFFNNTKNRDLLIQLVQEMDDRGGLDELAKVITSLSDSNFFGNVEQIFKCSEDVSMCRAGQVTREDIKNFFNFFHFKKEDIDKGNKILKSFVAQLSATNMGFFNSLSHDLSSEEFKKSRYDLINQFLLKFRKEDIKDDIRFLRNILAGKNKDGHSRILELVTKKMNENDFLYLVKYPAVKDPNMWKDFRLLNDVLKENISCNGFVGDRSLSINLTDELNFVVKDLFSKDKKYFFASSVEALGVLKTAQSICNKFSFYEAQVVNPLSFETEIYNLNYVTTVSRMTKLAMLSNYFELLKYLQGAVPEGIADKNVFLIKFMSTDFQVSVVQFIQALDDIDSSLMGSIWDLLKVADDEFVDDLMYFMNWILKKDIKEIQSLGRVWASMDKEAQFFFFNYLDSHYKEGVDIRLLFNFYSAILDNFSVEVATTMDRYFSTSESLNKFIDAIENMASNLGGEDLIEDYRHFFSRDHFIEIIKIISRGTIDKGGKPYILAVDPHGAKPVGMSVDLGKVVDGDANQEKCLDKMSARDTDFYSIISKVPEVCRPLVKDNLFFNVIEEVNKLGEYIYGQGNRWSNYSLFSTQMLKANLMVGNYLSEEYKSVDGEGITSIVSDVQKFVNDDERKKHLVATLELLKMFNSETETSVVSAFTDFYSVNENFDVLKDVVKGLNSTLNTAYDYHRGKLREVLSKNDFVEVEEYQCRKFNNKHIGADPCPDRKRLGFIKDSLIEKFLRKNGNSPTALELLVTAILPEHGLKIPFLAKDQKLKRITFSETFAMMFDLTNGKFATNNMAIEYQEIPKAVDSYFEKEWEIEKKMMKGAPAEKEYKMNTMERIETVIRDVRFDADYLGAHYMNSVAKAEEYDREVAAKYFMLSKCVPLKFCGKFMNKSQHRLGRNAKQTFQGLADVNIEEGWQYGDYMKALLQIMVASSPESAQKSTAINKRILGINIEIPLLMAKKTLLHHNGKILTDLSMVSAFSNSARVLRDRVGRSEEEFKKFITSARLKRFDKRFMKNVLPESLISFAKDVIIKGQKNGYIDSVLDFFYGRDYLQQRLMENIGAKFAVASTYLADETLPDKYQVRYKDLTLLDIDKSVDWALDHYEELARVLPLDDNEFLGDMNHFLDVLLFKFENKDQGAILLFNELIYFAVKNQDQLLANLESIRNAKALQKLRFNLADVPKLIKDLNAFDPHRELPSFIGKLVNSDALEFGALQKWFAASSAQEVCFSQLCEKNKAYGEINKTLNYLLENKGSRLFHSVKYLAVDRKRDLDFLMRKVFSSLTIQ